MAYTWEQSLEKIGKKINDKIIKLEDIKVGFDGRVYENAAESVRGQISLIINKKSSINILNPDDVQTNKFYGGNEKEVSTLRDNSTFCCVKIKCKSGETYTCTSTDYSINFLDKDGKIISKSASATEHLSNYTFNIPEGIDYFTLSWQYTKTPISSYMLVKGANLPPEYTPYKPPAIYLNDELEVNNKIKDFIQGEEYHVGKGYEYTSFVDCLKKLQGNENKKTIYVHGGTYDIFEEYGGQEFANSVTDTNFRTWCVRVPKNTHILGVGKVVLNYLPEKDQTTVNCSKVIGVLNIDATCTVENLEIHSKNSRYCIHDETSKLIEYNNSTKKYKNVRCYQHLNDSGYGYGQAYAAGFNSNMKYEFENCLFETENYAEAFSMHNTSDSNMFESSSIVIKDSIFNGNGKKHSIRFGNVNDVISDINVLISNSYIKGETGLLISDEYENSKLVNGFNVTLLNCNTITPEITASNNTYTVKIYK